MTSSKRQHTAHTTHVDEFLAECLNSDPGGDKGLDRDEFFGLYTSWCLLLGCPPQPAEALWHALKDKGIIPGRNTLAMTGPAAADYIISSAPPVI